MSDRHPRTNFGVLRLVAALMVLVGHAYPLTGRAVEPLAASTGVTTLGALGVHVFFAISGFLVTTSWIADPDVGRFVARRLLRILPALVVVVLLSVFVLGPSVTDRSTTAYFADGMTWRYLGSALTYPIRYRLPGVFEHNPVAGVVNGSLWTLPFEVLMYAGVVVLGAGGVLRRTGSLAALLALVCAVSAAAWKLGETHGTVVAEIEVRYLLAFAISFVAGMLLAADERIPRSVVVATAALAACALLLHSPWLRIWMPLAVAYATVVIGTRPVEPFAAVGERTDLSYGTYLYAYPVEQLVVTWVATSVAGVVALALPLTALLAVASWWLVEAPALRLKPARPRRPQDEVAERRRHLAHRHDVDGLRAEHRVP